MKKLIALLLLLLTIIVCSSFTSNEEVIVSEQKQFSIDSISSTERKYKTQEINTCGLGNVKSYMDYRAITNTASLQYKYIEEHMTVDEETGFLYDEDGFIGAALGSYYGKIGDRYYFTLENGVEVPIVKIESKADIHTDGSNCYNPNDGSVIEFVVDTDKANEYFGQYGNNLVLSGNYGNYPLLKGQIIKVEKVLDEKIESPISYQIEKNDTNKDIDIFYYASGY